MKRIIISLTFSLIAMFAVAQEISREHKVLFEEAIEFYTSDEFQPAGEILSQLLSIYPQDVEFNYLFGVCSVNNGSSPDISIKHLEYATKMGARAESFYYLGKAYHINYDFDKAISAFNSFKSKADSKLLERYDADHQILMCTNGKSLMNNIKDLVVMDKKVSGEDDFFRYYELTSMGGKLLSVPNELKSRMDKKMDFNGVLFYNGSSNEVYFASYGDKGLTGKDIYMSRILPNGKYAEPQKIPGVINTNYDEDFPFLHPNGKTMYFSSKGHSSMGGYDVFRSEFNDGTGKYGVPVNLDFAINTPDDDILYVTDSLHQEAWFASGRNISSGSYNIYNVKVKGVPMNLTFLKGTFGTTYDEDLKVAYIVVRDELTNREVSKVYTDPDTGEYIISLYKPGQYKFEVKAKNSQITHEGYVDVPFSESSAVYSQQLSLIKSESLEKLVIYNDFDTPLDYDIAELQKEMLRKKSTLDINADRDAILEEDPEVLVNVDKTIGNATLAAGFAEGITIKDVVEDSKKDIEEKRKELEEIENSNGYALAYALEMQDLAQQKVAESKSMRESADPSNVEDYENRMKEADKVLFEANQYALSSKAAMRIAQRGKRIAEQNRIDINEIENNVKAVIEGEMNNDFDQASTALRWEKDRINSKKGITATTPGELAIEESKRVENQETALLKEMETLADEETALMSRIKRNEENTEREKKKSKKVALVEEGLALNDELAQVQKILNSDRKEFRILGKEEMLLKKEAEFYNNQYIVPESMKVNPIDLDSPELLTFDNDYELLDEEIDLAMFDRDLNRFTGDENILYADNASEKIDDNIAVVENAETDTEDLALTTDPIINDEVMDTENPLSNDAATQDVAINDTTDSTSDTEITSADAIMDPEVVNEVKNSDNEKAVKAKQDEAYVSIALMEKDIASLEKDINDFENGSSDVYTAEEIFEKRTQLSEKQDTKKVLRNSIQLDPISEEESLAIYKEIEPEYRENIQSIISDNDNEIDQSLKILDYKKEVKSKLKTVIGSNQSRLATLTDEDEIADLSRENVQYREAYNKLNEEIYDVDNFKAAFESENKDIVESEEIIAIKLNDQVKLTNQFIAGMDEVLEETNAEIRNSSSSEEKEILKELVVDLTEERDQAIIKLENYEEDLALSTSAEDFDMESLNTASNEKVTAKDPKAKRVIETPVNGGSFNEIFADVPTTKPEDAFYSNMFDHFVDRTQGTKYEIDNMDKVAQLEDEIYELEMRHLEAPEEEKAELDKTIEKKFTELSKLELRNYSRMHKFSEEEMKANALKIDSLKTAKHSSVEKRIILDELKKLTKAIDFESVELESTRNDIPDSEDYIEQSFIARQAFGLETSIIQKQRKMISIYENTDLLNSLSDTDVRDMNAGRYIEEEEEIEIQINSDIDWALLDEELSIQDLDSSEYINDLRNGNSSRATDPVYMDHLRLVELKLMDQSRSIENRNTLQEEYNDLQEEIEVLEYSIANTKKKKDREVLEIQLAELTAKADVMYAQIAKHNEDISRNESELSEMLTVDIEALALNNTNSNIIDESSDDVNALKLDEASTDIPNRDADDVVSSDLAETKSAASDSENNIDSAAEVSSNTETNIDSNTTVNTADNTTKPNITNAELGDGDLPYAELYNFPEVLTSNIFRTHPSTGKRRTIPMNVKLPSGTVYKVQVGAFRNPIDSKVFDGFSPVTGETINNGITRYTAGLFLNYDNADDAKKIIRELGYSDAFVVKFVDGKRVSISSSELGDIAQNSQISVTPIDVVTSNTNRDQNENQEVNTNTPKTNVDTSEFSEDLLNAAKSDETGQVAQDYYNSFQDAANAKSVESVDGVFFTVQIGVYSRPVPASELNNINPLNAELLDGGKYRYSTGIYDDINNAIARKTQVAQSGFADAFVTAYYNGKRITVAKAKEMLSAGTEAAKAEAVTTRTSRNGSLSDIESQTENTTTNTTRNTENDTPSNNTTSGESGTVTMELETPVVVKTKVNEKSDGEPIRMIQMEYDVLLVSTTQEEIPEMVRRAMERFGDEWGIKAVRKGDYRLVYTKKVKSLQEARNMMKELEAFGVVEPEIRAFRMDKNL